MLWLVMQIWALIVGAFVLGVLAGATLLRRSAASPGAALTGAAGAKTADGPLTADAFPVDALPADAPRPGSADEASADDLMEIIGVDQPTMHRLNGLGVFTLAQIAGWTDANIRWIDEQLGDPGRVDRERWVEQAESLADGA